MDFLTMSAHSHIPGSDWSDVAIAIDGYYKGDLGMLEGFPMHVSFHEAST